MYAVNLGTIAVPADGKVNIFIDDLTNGDTGRTSYDGVGIEPIPDTDGDGLPDVFEQTIINADIVDNVTGLSDVMGTGAVTAVTDFDNDGANDREEFQNQTDPLNPDSDGDGLLDGVETNTATYINASDTGTDPLNPDTDEDGLLDGVETNSSQFVDQTNTGTHPLEADSDGDGLRDGLEVEYGHDPTDAKSPNLLPMQTPRQIAPDGVWTWFNDERAIWHLGKLYTGYVLRNGKVGLSRFDPATLESTHVELSSFTQRDDHNNPSILSLPDHRLMVVYSEHNGKSFRRVSSVSEPAGLHDWGNELPTPDGRGISYANTYRLAEEEHRLYHFNRDIAWNPTLSVSNDAGSTFQNPVHFIATGAGNIRPYPKYVSNDRNRIDLIYTDGHPRNENNSIYHLYYQDGAFRKTDGTIVENMAGLPLEHDQGKRGSEVYTYSASSWGPDEGPDNWIPSGRAWTWDIQYGAEGHPVCVFQVQRDNVTGSGWNHDRIYYYYARWTGTEWQRRFIAHGGRGIYSAEDDYGGGITIDPDHPNVVYISTNAANPFELSEINQIPLNTNERYEIWRGVTKDGGVSFQWTPVTLDSPVDNLRPFVPSGHGFDRHVIWFRGNYTFYTNFDTEVVGLFQNELKVSGMTMGAGGVELQWNSMPGKVYRVMGSENLLSFPFEVASNIPSEGASTFRDLELLPSLRDAPRSFFRIEDQTEPSSGPPPE